jgi:hypothetical protein
VGPTPAISLDRLTLFARDRGTARRRSDDLFPMRGRLGPRHPAHCSWLKSREIRTVAAYLLNHLRIPGRCNQREAGGVCKGMNLEQHRGALACSCSTVTRRAVAICGLSRRERSLWADR